LQSYIISADEQPIGIFAVKPAEGNRLLLKAIWQQWNFLTFGIL
jgi:hypothetical protein